MMLCHGQYTDDVLHQSSRYLAGCFYTDVSGIFEMTTSDGTIATSSSAEKNITSTLQAVVAAGYNSQWLVLVRPQGVMEVRQPSVHSDLLKSSPCYFVRYGPFPS